MTESTPSPEELNERITNAFVTAIEKIVGAVAAGAGTAAQAGQSTSGAESAIGGVGTEVGLSSQGATSDVGAKVDVSVPEGMESLNFQVLESAAMQNKSNAKLYDLTATALGFATLGAGANMYATQCQQVRHAEGQ